MPKSLSKLPRRKVVVDPRWKDRMVTKATKTVRSKRRDRLISKTITGAEVTIIPGVAVWGGVELGDGLVGAFPGGMVGAGVLAGLHKAVGKLVAPVKRARENPEAVRQATYAVGAELFKARKKFRSYLDQYAFVFVGTNGKLVFTDKDRRGIGRMRLKCKDILVGKYN